MFVLFGIHNNQNIILVNLTILKCCLPNVMFIFIFSMSFFFLICIPNSSLHMSTRYSQYMYYTRACPRCVKLFSRLRHMTVRFYVLLRFYMSCVRVKGTRYFRTLHPPSLSRYCGAVLLHPCRCPFHRRGGRRRARDYSMCLHSCRPLGAILLFMEIWQCPYI